MKDNTVTIRWSETWSQTGQVVEIKLARVVVSVASFPTKPLHFDFDTGLAVAPTVSIGGAWPRINGADLERIKKSK